MLIGFISDTHLVPKIGNPEHEKLLSGLKYCDILIHCGDATGVGTPVEVAKFSAWFSSLPPKHKIYVPGNHDKGFERDSKRSLGLLDPSITCLINESIIVEGIKIYGSPYTPTFGHDWAFNLDRGRIHLAWNLIPDDTQILVTHGPPHGIRDWSLYTESHAGCEALRDRVKQVKPKVHAFGHIHFGYGTETIDNTCFINAAACNEDYRFVNPPIIIQW